MDSGDEEEDNQEEPEVGRIQQGLLLFNHYKKMQTEYLFLLERINVIFTLLSVGKSQND